MDSQSRCVVVTGFGPFRQHLVNSSWEAVKTPEPKWEQLGMVVGACDPSNEWGGGDGLPWCLLTSWPRLPQELSKLGLGVDIELQTLQLPVDYREVKQRLIAVWEEFQPQLAVHVGMDTSTKAIFLEQCGKNRGYRDSDVRGFQPEDGVCLPGGPEVMLSVINMKEVCRRVAVEDVEVAFSRDAGRYICDYTYYLSLHLGTGHAALIHIPPLSPWLSVSLLGKALQVIIREMLEESGEVQTQRTAA